MMVRLYIPVYLGGEVLDGAEVLTHKEIAYLHSWRCRSGDLEDIRDDDIVHCTPYRQRTLQIDRDIKHCVGVTVKPIKGFAQHYALVALE